MVYRFIFVVMLFFPMCLSAQVEKRSFEYQYKILYGAYCENAGDVTNLLNLTEFYMDKENPLRSFYYAKKYMRMVEARYLSIVGNDKYYRELNKLIKKGVTIDSIRSMNRKLDEAAISYVRESTDWGMDEIENFLRDYGHNKIVRDLLYHQRVSLEYEKVLQSGNVDSCYRFMKKYAGTKMALNLDTVITASLRNTIDTSFSIHSVNAIAFRYSECLSLQRLAYKRCAQLGYEDACAVNTIDAYRNYLSTYSGSDKYFDVLQKMEDLEEKQLDHLKEADEIVDFMLANNSSPLFLVARKRLLDKIFLDHDVLAIELYLEHFKMDSAYTDVFELYYGWHSVEGNLAPLVDFHSRYPEFPFRMVLESDLQKAIFVDDVFLMEPFSESKLSDYTRHLHRLTGKDISFVVLQRMLQGMIAKRDWQSALNRMEDFSLSFEDHCYGKYSELRGLILSQNRYQRQLSVEVTPGYNMMHPIVHPKSGDLFYFRKDVTGGDVHCASPVSGMNYRWKSVGPLEIDYNILDSCQIVPFCFYDNGEKMLLGAKGDIWIAEVKDNVWRVVQRLPNPVNTKYLETDAFMLQDGSGLLLASDRPGGYNVQRSGAYFHGDTAAATDLYFVPYSDGRWGNAVNLGKDINSIYCERSPILSKNKRTLYFVSDGRAGFGYGDVYCASRTDVDNWTSWSLPENAGKEVNTGFDEGSVSFSPDESRLYISSNSRNGRYGCYSTPSWHNSTSDSYYVNIVSKEMSLPIFAYIFTTVSPVFVDSVVINDTNGRVHLEGSSERLVVFKSNGDLFVPSVQLPSEAGSVLLDDHTISEWAMSGKEIVLPLIGMDSSTMVLNSLSRIQISEVVRLLNSNQGYAVDVMVDVRGESSLAYDMSVDLGMAIKESMVSQGLESGRIRLMPYGELRSDGNSFKTRVSVRFSQY